MRQDQQRKARARFIPDAIAAVRAHLEAVTAGRHAPVGGHAIRAGIHPIRIQAHQPVAEAHPVRRGEVKAGEAEFQAQLAGRNPERRGGRGLGRNGSRGIGRQGLGLPVHKHLLDPNDRGSTAFLVLPRVDHDNAAPGGEAKQARASFQAGVEPSHALLGKQPVRAAPDTRMHGRDRARGQVF